MGDVVFQPRAPLADLPVAAFVLPDNLPATLTTLPPSPVSLPLKRGPPSALRDDRATEQTIKRHSRARVAATAAALDADELGTGKSPARRLFTSEAPATPSAASSKPVILAPPPLASPAAPRRSTRLAKLDGSSSSSSSSTAPGVHDPGFTVLCDDDPRARPRKPTAQRMFTDDDQENVPPSPSTGPEHFTAPNTGRRFKNFERSKLGTQIVTAPSPSPPRSGKDGLKREADGSQ